MNTTSEDFSEDTTSSIDLDDDEDMYLEENNTENEGLSLAEELYFFFLLFNLSNRAMDFLLKLLIRHNVPNVPKSFHYLKKCSKLEKFDTVSLSKGSFVYFSIKENLKFCVDKGLLVLKSIQLKLKFNIDGLPIYKSSNLSAWPILMQIDGCDLKFPLPVALFCGIQKPPLDVFLSELCNELRSLFTDNFVYRGVTFSIANILFLCDAPARCYLQCINFHNSKHGCGYCRVVGTCIEKRTIFDTVEGEPRTDAAYAQYLEDNQLSLSPLLSVPGVGLFTSIPPEYQHLICLGVVRRLTHFYFLRVKDFKLKCRLSSHQLQHVSSLIDKCKPFFPKEFNRKFRDLRELLNFKATEFRTFILYLAPFILRNVLPKQYYENLLLLHFSVYVFVSKKHTNLYKNAEASLQRFVAQCPSLFTQKCLVYNFHVLLHLPHFVNLYGPLDGWSTFFYENYLSMLKRRTKCTPSIFNHLCSNMMNIRELTTVCDPSHLFFSSDTPNNCCQYDDGFLMISGFFEANEKKCVSGYKLVFLNDLYDYPYKSSVLGIGYYKLSKIFVTDVIPNNKCICFPVNDNYLLLPYASDVYYG